MVIISSTQVENFALTIPRLHDKLVSIVALARARS